MQRTTVHITLLAIMLVAFPARQPLADPDRHIVENSNLKMVVIPRSAEQMAAFYEGREFPARAIEATRNACFFTISIRNKSPDILWHDTAKWTLTSQDSQVKRITRAQWRQSWRQLDVAQRFQSTFRWTLLPDTLDFQPGEREGGNLTISRIPHNFTLTARFATGENQQGQPVSVKFSNLQCREDPAT